MSIWEKLNWWWVKLFETCVILGTICIFAITGVAIGWVDDKRPLTEENPEPGTSYVETARIHPGDEVIIHRSFRRTDGCLSHSSVQLLSLDKSIVFPLQNYTGFGMPTTHFGVSRTGFMVPLHQAPGHYFIRTQLECQRNPLSLVPERLTDLPFEIVALDQPL